MLRILSLLKSLYLNIKILPIKDALKLPIIISWNTKLIGVKKGSIKFEGEIKRRGILKIGLGGSNSVCENKNSFLQIDDGGSLIISKEALYKGEIYFSKGSSIRISSNAKLKIGSNFYANKNCLIFCNKNISIGNDVLLGWNVNIRDSDGHFIISDDLLKENTKDIMISNHVWIASYVDILKGALIKENSVVACRSLITSTFKDANVLIGGVPGKVLKNNINWKL